MQILHNSSETVVNVVNVTGVVNRFAASITEVYSFDKVCAY